MAGQFAWFELRQPGAEGSLSWSRQLKQALGLDHLLRPWSDYTLSTRFLFIGSLIIIVTMALIGAWVDNRIRESVVRNASAVSALYMESLISGPVQELAHRDRLSAGAKQAISELIEDTVLGLTIMEIKVWHPDGAVVFASDATLVGNRPPITHELSEALLGRVTAEFNDRDDAESLSERVYGRPIFEVYAPVYQKGTQRIIGAAEIYEDATNLLRDFTIARQQSWLVVGSLTAAMMSILFAVVYRSSQLLVHQKAALEAKYLEQAELMTQNAELRARMASTHKKNADILDQQLRRVGADLHDGPAQLMALALLRLHEIVADDAPDQSARGNEPSVSAIRSAMEKALAETRAISAGLQLPELDGMTPEMVIRLAIENHQRLTKSEVSLATDAFPGTLPLAHKTCLFRCVQEGLSNAFRHANGDGQYVSATGDRNRIVLTIEDAGPGFDSARLQDSAKLGVSGMRRRVESMGGTFNIASQIGFGTKIRVTLPRNPPHDE
jgi:signal transduction histidine kinase